MALSAISAGDAHACMNERSDAEYVCTANPSNQSVFQKIGILMKTTFSSATPVIVHRIFFHHFCKQLILPFLFFYPFAFEQALEKIGGCHPSIPVCKDLTIPFVDKGTSGQ